MTPRDLAALREKAQAATPGPWYSMPVTNENYKILVGDIRSREMLRSIPFDDHDKDFIAAANPAVVLSLLDTAEAYAHLREKVGELRNPWGWAFHPTTLADGFECCWCGVKSAYATEQPHPANDCLYFDWLAAQAEKEIT